MKPSIPKGTRDFGPAEMQKRQFIFSVIRKNFELFGYQPLETPAMENITALTGKYGDEGDQLIFKVLNSRIHENKNKELLRKEFELSLETSRNSEALTEKALRYDLTVPFARYVVMHQHELTFPFKRYQIQPVWRADRPQKGRYREFYQCDADIIGSNSLLNELELISLIDKSFKELNIPVLLKFNNRKILTAIAEVIDEKEKIIDITVAIDKLDKIGKDGVVKELTEKNINTSAIEKLAPLFDFKGNNAEKVNILKTFVGDNVTGLKGIEEIEYLLNNTTATHTSIELDITLARGLNYYTGTIFEVKANAGTFTPSILGGGRYDDLTGIFGLPNMSGVGISFGIDRIYDVMEELNLFTENKTSVTNLLFVNFGKEEEKHCLKLASEIRNQNISCEVYPETTKKLAKQFEYADKKHIPYVCVVGSNEIVSQRYVLKDMANGTQEELNIEEIIKKLKR
jgi:histidyl-tRNA synthetase